MDLRSLLDIAHVQTLMDDFYALTGFPVGIVDLSGNVLVAVGWQDVCTKFHRVHPETRARCLESDLKISSDLQPGECRSYHCRNNMIDVATPIFIAGNCVGNLYLGQFFYSDEEIDWRAFRAQSERYGFPWQKYKAALEKVPRWDQCTVEKAMAFYVDLITLLSQQSYSNLLLAGENSARKKVEEDLLRSEVRFRDFYEHTPAAYFSLDENGHIIDMNWQFEDLLGYGKDELIGRSFGELWSIETRPMFGDKFAHMRDRGAASIELNLVRKDDRRVVVLLEGRVQRTAAGGFACAHCLLTNITQREGMESRLRESEQKLRSLFDNANDAIVLQRPGGKFIDVNRIACERLCYSREELLRLRPREIDDPEWDDRVDAAMARVLSEGSCTYETINLTSSGARIPTEVSATLMRYGGETVILSILRDISDRKRAQSALALANHKLQLMTGVTRHDLQNQLMVLRGQLELARRELSEGKTRDKVLKALNAASEIEEMLKFSKEYQELGVEAPAWQNVAALLKLASNSARNYGLSMAADGIQLEVYADRMLAKVFQNLVDNTARHGVRATSVRVYAYDDGAWMRLVYEDDGVGVPISEKERIFDREHGKNTGLGLFFAREILAITGLEIQECGTDGVGARFMINVPREQWRKPPAPAAMR
jgi:PAS domain S-box-containing protein